MTRRTAVSLHERPETQQARDAPLLGLEGCTFYVHCVGGNVVEVGLADRVRVRDEDVLFLFGDAVIQRLPRTGVYFASRKNVPVPVLFERRPLCPAFAAPLPRRCSVLGSFLASEGASLVTGSYRFVDVGCMAQQDAEPWVAPLLRR